MNARTAITPSALLAAALLAAPLFAAPASAAGGEPQDGTTLKPVRAIAPPVQQKVFRGRQATRLLALETELEPKDVRMIETTISRGTSYAFRSQQRTGQRFAEALGPERYAAWSRGRPIPLYSPAVIEEANRMAGTLPDGRARAIELVAVNP